MASRRMDAFNNGGGGGDHRLEEDDDSWMDELLSDHEQDDDNEDMEDTGSRNISRNGNTNMNVSSSSSAWTGHHLRDDYGRCSYDSSFSWDSSPSSFHYVGALNILNHVKRHMYGDLNDHLAFLQPSPITANGQQVQIVDHLPIHDDKDLLCNSKVIAEEFRGIMLQEESSSSVQEQKQQEQEQQRQTKTNQVRNKKNKVDTTTAPPCSSPCRHSSCSQDEEEVDISSAFTMNTKKRKLGRDQQQENGQNQLQDVVEQGLGRGGSPPSSSCKYPVLGTATCNTPRIKHVHSVAQQQALMATRNHHTQKQGGLESIYAFSPSPAAPTSFSNLHTIANANNTNNGTILFNEKNGNEEEESSARLYKPAPFPSSGASTCTTSSTTTNTALLPRLQDYHLERWEARYRDLVAFKEMYGHCNVPNIYPPNKQLAQWVKRQRYQHRLLMTGNKRSAMTEERRRILDDINFVWDAHEAAWWERWTELQDFFKEHGHSNVPTNYSLNRRLSIWVKCQRRQYKIYTKQLKQRTMMAASSSSSDVTHGAAGANKNKEEGGTTAAARRNNENNNGDNPGSSSSPSSSSICDGVSNMTPERIACLRSLDFVFNPRERRGS